MLGSGPSYVTAASFQRVAMHDARPPPPKAGCPAALFGVTSSSLRARLCACPLAASPL